VGVSDFDIPGIGIIMQMDNEEAEAVALTEFRIGRVIEAELHRQGRSVAWLSRKINCDRRNMYDIFARRYIDTGLLFRISLALGTDFFKHYSDALNMEPHPELQDAFKS